MIQRMSLPIRAAVDAIVAGFSLNADLRHVETGKARREKLVASEFLPVQKPNFRNHLRHAHISFEIQFAPVGGRFDAPDAICHCPTILAASLHILRPRRLYEPVEIGGRRFEKRDAEARWEAVAKTIRHYDAHSIHARPR